MTVFVAQVRSGRSVDPNFRPERKRTFAQAGSPATSSRFKRSQVIVSMPSRFSSSTRASDENRDTAMTLRGTPSASAARLILRASEGPIFPPAPKTMKSPFSRRTDSRSSALGAAICSSRLSTDSIKFMICTFRGYRLQFYRALQLFKAQLISTRKSRRYYPIVCPTGGRRPDHGLGRKLLLDSRRLAQS